MAQGSFTFDRPAKFELLRAAEPRLGHKLQVRRNVYQLLEQLEYLTGREGCRPALETLAARMRVSVRTVQRTIAAAAELSVLRVERQFSRGREIESLYWTDWEAVRRLGCLGSTPAPAHAREDRVLCRQGASPAERADQTSGAPADHSNDPPAGLPLVPWGEGGKPVTPGVSAWHPGGDTVSKTVTVSVQNGHRVTPVFLPEFQEENPPPASTQLAEVTRWEEEEEVFLGLGLDQAAEALAAFRTRGGTLAELAAIRRHYESRPGAYGAGALHFRLRKHRPGLAASRSWPDPKPGWAPPVSAARQERTARARRYYDANGVVRRARRAGQSDEEITAELALAGFTWDDLLSDAEREAREER